MDQIGGGASPIQSVGRPAAGGAKIVLRRTWSASAAVSVTETVPTGAAFAVWRGVGPGGGGTTYSGGGNGAYARAKVTVTAGETFTVAMPARSSGTPSADTTVTRVTGSAVVLKAAKGTVGIDSNATNNSGQAANCIGDVTRSGGQSGAVSTGQFFTRSATQGSGGPVTANNYGGSSAGDRSDADTLIMGGTSDDDGGAKFSQFGRPGAAMPFSDITYHGYTVDQLGGGGQIFVEYWDGDPDA